MVALIVAMMIMGVMLSVALPAWQTIARREKEAELVFRGEQYARAIAAFQRKYANTFPPSVDVLVSEKFLRKKYLDPITGEDFDLITPGSAIAGSTTPTALQAGAGGRAGAAQGARGAAASQGARGAGSAASSISTGFSLNTSGGSAATGGRAAQPATAAGRATNSTVLASARGGFSTTTGAFGATTGVMGVRSKSKDKSLRAYNGAETYDQWLFMATQATLGLSAPGGALAPGAGGRGGRAGPQGQTPTTGGRGGMQPLQPSLRGRGEGGAAAPRGGATPPARGGGFGGGGTGGRGF
jgi:type II secretory pathway pseudopilin PulG